MLSNDELSAAVSAGVIGRTDAEKLAAFLATHRAGHADLDESFDDAESIRFVRGLHDVFLAIGVTLLIVGVGYTAELVATNAWPFAVGIAAWALAEYFTSAKRLTLPSIALSIAFGVAGGFALRLIGINSLSALREGGDANLYMLVAVALGMFIASAAFYLRFRLPFTLAQLVACIAGGAAIVSNASPIQLKLVLLALGLLAFSLAITFDLRDPQRRTTAADNAFWLHLAAAPLIVNAAIGFVWGEKSTDLGLPSALITMAVISALAFVALVIDRRALLVSGLFYFGSALFVIIRKTAVQEPTVLAITLLILGGSLVLLGVGWRTLRRLVVMALIPPELARRLPTLRTDSQ
jgi:hypothetical protein